MFVCAQAITLVLNPVGGPFHVLKHNVGVGVGVGDGVGVGPTNVGVGVGVMVGCGGIIGQIPDTVFTFVMVANISVQSLTSPRGASMLKFNVATNPSSIVLYSHLVDPLFQIIVLSGEPPLNIYIDLPLESAYDSNWLC